MQNVIHFENSQLWPKPYCELCKKYFSCTYNLTLHKKHTHSEETTFYLCPEENCKKIQRKFKFDKNLESHLKDKHGYTQRQRDESIGDIQTITVATMIDSVSGFANSAMTAMVSAIRVSNVKHIFPNIVKLFSNLVKQIPILNRHFPKKTGQPTQMSHQREQETNEGWRIMITMSAPR